jgi:hypothetical protein
MSSDFGVMGQEPTHAALLDWLAGELVANGWSMKKMHRLLVTSESYQLASAATDAAWNEETIADTRATWSQANRRDPKNVTLWRHRRARLDGETIRDCMLAASGRLSPRTGGPGVRPPLPPEITATLLKDQWIASKDEEEHRRRSIYLFVRRNLRYPLFDVHDRPDTNASCAMRHESTTAPQSLMLFNSQFSLQCAQHLAGVVIREQFGNRAGQIQQAFARVLSRQPSRDEIEATLEFLTRQESALRAEKRSADGLALPTGIEASDNPFADAALVDFCLALFNTNEFVYLE